jgi:preprotein translocase subunit SecG
LFFDLVLKEISVVTVLSILLVITSILMVLLVLLHKGKGSGLSDLFGGGISSSYGGSSVVEKNLDRITVVVGGLWFAAVIALSLVLKK